MRTIRHIMLMACVLGSASTAAAQGVYFSTEQVLKEFFRASERVSYTRLDTAANASELRRRLGYLPKKKSYVIFVAKTADKIDGYAVIDEELGQHMPIGFATKLSEKGRVQRAEVMVYREGYGSEIREVRFRKQFVGKGSDDPLRLNRDIDAVTGATISSRSMAVAVKRAVALVGIVRSGVRPVEPSAKVRKDG